MRRLGACFAVALVSGAFALVVASKDGLRTVDPRLVVHEWGTFTSLQDEEGRAIENVSPEEESLPPFVYTPREIAPAVGSGITMRLETPVIYFYPQGTSTRTLDVTVTFRGGWLTEFYPWAESEVRGAVSMSRGLEGTLRWRGLRLNDAGQVPDTHERVWTAPREVHATTVTTAKEESERYLFYRGVGRIDAPLRVRLRGGELEIKAGETNTGATIPRLWLVERRFDGSLAWKALGPFDRASSGLPLPASFGAADFSQDGLEGLKTSMHAGLVEAGLFSDEAQAMLNTWEASYFKSAGLRLFFLVPREWTDEYLPLSVSVPTETERVMVGRIEIVTPLQRAYIDAIATGRSAVRNMDLYQGLGRFRSALLMDELRLRPTAYLRDFIDRHVAPKPQCIKCSR